MNHELARRNKCDAMCPVSTAIFLQVVAQAALEAVDADAEPAAVAPFWRVVAPDDKLVGKLSVDGAWIALRRGVGEMSAGLWIASAVNHFAGG